MAAFILIKLGDDDSFVIGELHNESEEDVVLKYPIVIRLKTTADYTTSVSSSKLMPFSENNIVALKKSAIVGFSKPNEKIIKFYLRFLDKFKQLLDNELEDDICGLQDELEGEELHTDDEDQLVPLTQHHMLH